MLKRRLFFVLLFISFMSVAAPGHACESCLCTVIGRRDAVPTGGKVTTPVFFDFLFEQQNWNTSDAREAHTLHHEGHHVHNKTHEEYYHFIGGVNPHERVTLFADLPYVARRSAEIDEHARSGRLQTSEGMGDLQLIGVWRFFQNEQGFLGATAGVKLPTGETDNQKPERDLIAAHAAEEAEELEVNWEYFEPELQPGSGSVDVPVGGVFRYVSGPVTFRGNAVYTIKTEGVRNYEFGDVFTASLVTDLTINPGASMFRTDLGLDLNFQHEEKHVDNGREVADSGGDTLFAGPSLTVMVNENSLVYGTILFPVAQNLGGVHQELDFTWTGGARIQW